MLLVINYTLLTWPTFDAHLLGVQDDQIIVEVLALDLLGLVVFDESHELVLLAQPLLL